MKTNLRSRALGLLVFFLILSGACTPAEDGNLSREPASYSWESARVGRVVDGDTLVLEDGRRLRLIGINAPEMGDQAEEFGREASERLKVLVEGRQVFLQKDVSETDQFGRLLRYIWLVDPEELDETAVRNWMVNALLVSEGFAQPYTFPPDVAYAELFLELAREARADEVGLWAISPEGTTRGTPLDQL